MCFLWHDPCQSAKRFISKDDQATFVTRICGLTRETQQTTDRTYGRAFDMRSFMAHPSRMCRWRLEHMAPADQVLRRDV